MSKAKPLTIKEIIQELILQMKNCKKIFASFVKLIAVYYESPCA
jgi:hypothetical protein